VTVGYLGEVCEQDRRYAAVLPGVSHNQRDLGHMLAHPGIHRVGHHDGRVPGHRHQAEPVRVVHVERPLCRPLDVRITKETKPDRIGRQPLEKRPDCLSVIRANRTHMDRRTIV
jgi:hypothetical protein